MFPESDDTLLESFSVYLEEDANPPESIFNADTFKSFILEQISQVAPPETQPLAKRPDPPQRRMSFVETTKTFKPLKGSFSVEESELPQKPLRKWTKAINVMFSMFKFSRKFSDSSKSIQENTLTNNVQEKDVKENINIKYIYQASFRKIVEKKLLLEQILITNFIISIVDTNRDVTLSRPKTIRKKISRTVNKMKGDSKKAKEFLVKKGVALFDYRNVSENVGGKRVPGRSKIKGLEEDTPLALLK